MSESEKASGRRTLPLVFQEAQPELCLKDSYKLSSLTFVIFFSRYVPA